MNNYEQQANDFLAKNGITLTVTKAVPQTCPKWGKCEPYKFYPSPFGKQYAICPHNHGFEYSIELKRDGTKSSLVFPFWTSISDTYTNAAKSALRDNFSLRLDTVKGAVAPNAYSVLAGISGDASAHNLHFVDWCNEYGYSNDSIQAKAIYDYSCKFSRDISRFFTPTELEELSEIQ
jgi:hypothetical protein